MTFPNEKISMSTSSTDKYIQGMFIQLYMMLTFLAKYCMGSIFCTDIYKSAWG